MISSLSFHLLFTPFHLEYSQKTLIISATLSDLWGPPLFAQTPDGATPANEGVCDELVGATPGLYGLCVAYCEAQDCDLTTGPANISAQCKASNPKVLQNYNKRKNASDPDMPCIQDACPCWNLDELASIDGVLRREDPYANEGFLCNEDLSNANIVEFGEDFGTLKNNEQLRAWTFIGVSGPQCSFHDQVIVDGTQQSGGIFRDFVLDEVDYALCREQVFMACTTNGL